MIKDGAKNSSLIICFQDLIVQYILSIVSLFVSLIICFIKTDCFFQMNEFIYQSLIAISSNICSIACTLSFLTKNDEEDGFQSQRTIIIVFSLVINILLIFITSFDIPLGWNNHPCLIVLLITIVSILLIMMIKIQVKVHEINKERIKIADELTNEQKKFTVEAKSINTIQNGSEVYNVEGE